MANLGQITIVIVTLGICYMYFLKPFFNEENVLLLEAWVFTDSLIVNVLVLASHYYFFIIVVPIAIGYDAFYFALCIDVMLQVQLLKIQLRALSFKDVTTSAKEIKLCIGHHQFLIS